MEKVFIAHIDAITKQETIREMTDEEYAQHLLDVEAEEARIAAESNATDTPSE